MTTTSKIRSVILAGAALCVLAACQASPGVSGGAATVGTPLGTWSALAAADVEVNVALGAVTYLGQFELQVPGAKATVQAAGNALAQGVVTQANDMASGASPAVQTKDAAIGSALALVPQLGTLLTTKQTGSGSSVTVLADLISFLGTESSYVIPAVANAIAGSTTASQLASDEAALVVAAGKL
jgi:hypothetical protein